jgi:hypothetical protein
MVSGSRPVRRLFFITSSIKEFCTASNLFYGRKNGHPPRSRRAKKLIVCDYNYLENIYH